MKARAPLPLPLHPVALLVKFRKHNLSPDAGDATEDALRASFSVPLNEGGKSEMGMQIHAGRHDLLTPVCVVAATPAAAGAAANTCE